MLVLPSLFDFSTILIASNPAGRSTVRLTPLLHANAGRYAYRILWGGKPPGIH